MAITVDSTSFSSNTSGTSQTTSHTCSGTNRILFVSAWTRGANTPTATYNGVSMTIIGSKVGPNADGDYVSLFYLLNPSSGTNNIVVSLSAANLIGTTAVSYNDTTNSFGLNASNTYGPTTATSDSVQVTTTVDNCWIIMGGRTNGSGDIAAGSGTTLRVSSGSGQFQLFDSNGVKATGTQTLIGTHSSSESVYVIASFYLNIATSIIGPFPTYFRV